MLSTLKLRPGSGLTLYRGDQSDIDINNKKLQLGDVKNEYTSVFSNISGHTLELYGLKANIGSSKILRRQ
jgi:hypothetical protein